MSEATISITEGSCKLLQKLAEQTGQSVAEVVGKALDAYRRELFFEQMNAGYAELRADPQAWSEHLGERRDWDATLMDGLGQDERWTQDGPSANSSEEKS
jgi:hypothetical protein